MKGIFSYSAVCAKLAAMRGRLLTRQQYQELASSGSIPAAAEYLKQLPSYLRVFADTDAEKLHREQIERLLWLSLYDDYSSLYRFANLNQRKFLELYFMHFEADILKRCLRNVMFSRSSELDLSIYEEFFKRHSRLNLVGLAGCDTLAAFLEGLRGSDYYEPFNRLAEEGVTGLFDYETALDTVYFIRMWKELKKGLAKSEQEAVTGAIGERVDLLNLEWLARAKKNYRLSADGIRQFLIPISFRLKKEELDAMANAADYREFLALAQKTRYGKQLSENESPDFRLLLHTVYQTAEHKNPYSAAALNSFFYFKELEIQKIITAIEGIRYQLNRNEIMACLAGI